MRTAQLIVMCLLTFGLQAQDNDTLISQNFEVQGKKSKMGLMNTTSGKWEIPMENCFLYIAEQSNALLKVSGNNIEVYTYYSDTLRLVHQSTQKSLLSFSKFQERFAEGKPWREIIEVGDSVIDAKEGKKPSYFLPRYYHIDSELGVEILEDRLIIQDRKMDGLPGNVPLIDEDPESPTFGEHLIVTDPNSGLQYFVYAPPAPGVGSSGVYDRNSGEWIVQSVNFAITPTNNGYVCEELMDRQDESGTESIYFVFDEQMDLMHVPFNETELFTKPDFFKYLVPHFKSDSIVALNESELNLLEHGVDVPIRFYSGNKVGVFDWGKREVLVEPKDLFLPLECIEESWVAVDGNQIQFTSPFMTESYGFDEGDKLTIVTDYRSYPRDGLIAVRKEEDKSNQERLYLQTGYKNFRATDTSSMQDKTFEEFLDFGAHCVLENLGNGLIMVNHQQGLNMGTVPLIDEDPNSPRFGENLIVIDSITGMESFVYDVLVEYSDNSGVFDLKTHSWLIPPQFYFIEATEENFISHTGDSYWMVDVQTTYDLQGNVISVKEEGENWLDGR